MVKHLYYETRGQWATSPAMRKQFKSINTLAKSFEIYQNIETQPVLVEIGQVVLKEKIF